MNKALGTKAAPIPPLELDDLHRKLAEAEADAREIFEWTAVSLGQLRELQHRAGLLLGEPVEPPPAAGMGAPSVRTR